MESPVGYREQPTQVGSLHRPAVCVVAVGYMVNALAEGNWVAVISKVLVGFCYGLLLGWVRMKTGNCYATCLLHGLMNLLSI